MADNEDNEGADVSAKIDPWSVPHCGLTSLDDPTVGNGGNPYGGVGNSVLPKHLRSIGAPARAKLQIGPRLHP